MSLSIEKHAHGFHDQFSHRPESIPPEDSTRPLDPLDIGEGDWIHAHHKGKHIYGQVWGRDQDEKGNHQVWIDHRDVANTPLSKHNAQFYGTDPTFAFSNNPHTPTASEKRKVKDLHELLESIRNHLHLEGSPDHVNLARFLALPAARNIPASIKQEIASTPDFSDLISSIPASELDTQAQYDDSLVKAVRYPIYKEDTETSESETPKLEQPKATPAPSTAGPIPTPGGKPPPKWGSMTPASTAGPDFVDDEDPAAKPLTTSGTRTAGPTAKPITPPAAPITPPAPPLSGSQTPPIGESPFSALTYEPGTGPLETLPVSSNRMDHRIDQAKIDALEKTWLPRDVEATHYINNQTGTVSKPHIGEQYSTTIPFAEQETGRNITSFHNHALGAGEDDNHISSFSPNDIWHAMSSDHGEARVIDRQTGHRFVMQPGAGPNGWNPNPGSTPSTAKYQSLKDLQKAHVTLATQNFKKLAPQVNKGMLSQRQAIDLATHSAWQQMAVQNKWHYRREAINPNDSQYDYQPTPERLNIWPPPARSPARTPTATPTPATTTPPMATTTPTTTPTTSPTPTTTPPITPAPPPTTHEDVQWLHNLANPDTYPDSRLPHYYQPQPIKDLLQRVGNARGVRVDDHTSPADLVASSPHISDDAMRLMSVYRNQENNPFPNEPLSNHDDASRQYYEGLASEHNIPTNDNTTINDLVGALQRRAGITYTPPPVQSSPGQPAPEPPVTPQSTQETLFNPPGASTPTQSTQQPTRQASYAPTSTTTPTSSTSVPSTPEPGPPQIEPTGNPESDAKIWEIKNGLNDLPQPARDQFYNQYLNYQSQNLPGEDFITMLYNLYHQLKGMYHIRGALPTSVFTQQPM